MDEIERNIRRLSDEDLIRMVRIDHEEYTDDALFIARDEMRKREIPEEVLQGGSEEELEDGEETDSDGKGSAGGREACIRAFLAEELQYPESYRAILDFVSSMSIRSGEYEGGRFVVKKMDRENLILYTEEWHENAVRTIKGCAAVGKDELVERIEQTGAANGFVEDEEEGPGL